MPYVERRDGEDEQNSRVQIRDLHGDLAASHVQRVGPRNHGEGRQDEREPEHGCDHEVGAIDVGRNHHLLHQELHHVGDVMDESRESDAEDGVAVGTRAILNKCRTLALEPNQNREQRQCKAPDEDGLAADDDVVEPVSHYDATACALARTPVGPSLVRLTPANAGTVSWIALRIWVTNSCGLVRATTRSEIGDAPLGFRFGLQTGFNCCVSLKINNESVLLGEGESGMTRWACAVSQLRQPERADRLGARDDGIAERRRC